MRITFKQLKKCSVETLSGTVLGSVVDVFMETEGQHVVQYKVRESRIRGNEYLISRDQIARFEEEKIVVYDTAVPREARRREDTGKLNITAEQLAMREE